MAIYGIAMPRGILNYYTLILSLEILSGITRVSATCYYPNGTDRNAGFPTIRYAPINTGDNFSMCCTLTDKPRSDGLCENEPGTLIYRESCTDQTWQSPKCIKLCAGSSNGKGNRLSVFCNKQTDSRVQTRTPRLHRVARRTMMRLSHHAQMAATVVAPRAPAYWVLSAAKKVVVSS